ncbi:MAG: 50S ribosomal protein L29 [Candidatus Omnitrophica bacterium]|nr:50S ribosomal protein L29 [Candidatus Omnitrophota bacterium]
MKPEKAKSLRDLTKDELNQNLQDYRQELHKLRYDVKSGRVEKPDKIRIIRRNIARVLTILREKENAQS